MSKLSSKRSVLIVDDEESLRCAVKEYLTDAGYDVVESSSGPDAICKIVQETFDAVISDIRMPEMSGLDLIHVLDRLCKDTITILLTAVPDPNDKLAELAKEVGVFAYLNKPCKLQVIRETLELAFAEKEASQNGPQTFEVPDSPEDTTQYNQESSKTIKDIPEHIDDCPISPTKHTPSEQESQSKANSYFIAEIEDIINDANQLALQDEDSLKLSMEFFSHRFADLHLNSKKSIKEEIENVLLSDNVDIRQLSPREYIDLSKEEFYRRGWNDLPVTEENNKEKTSLLDLQKDGIGLKFCMQSPSIRMDMLNLHNAYRSGEIKIDACVIVIQTGKSQKYLKKSGTSWGGASYSEAIRILKPMQRQIVIPIYIFGLDISGSSEKYEIDLPSYTRNVNPVPMDKGSMGAEPVLDEMSSLQIKEYVFNFLETKYERIIDRNVKVKGKGRVLGLDGLMRLGTDVILEIEMNRAQMSSGSKSLSSIKEDLESQLSDYQMITGRKAVMRFILLGEFTPGFLKNLTWRIDYLRNNRDIQIDYEIVSFHDIGVRVYDGVDHLYMKE